MGYIINYNLFARDCIRLPKASCLGAQLPAVALLLNHRAATDFRKQAKHGYAADHPWKLRYNTKPPVSSP